ncbi:FAD-binding protein [Suicoccus acidiformans]|uniref:FAD-binding protein n=1 Tax=Suicoccus acidiformans TaxID=2036206 RepID=UPI0013C2A03D|nr:FAD-binding protein [Suicoccus acidiformans]
MDSVEILYNTKGESLIQSEDDEVQGVIVTNPDGSELILNAANGIILATGGFSKNMDLVLEYADSEKWRQLDKDTVSTNMNSIQGDGIEMGIEAGADLGDMDQMQFLYLGAPNTGILSGVYDVSAEIVIFVNQEGERFVAEDERRDVISLGVFDQTDAMMWLINSTDSLDEPENNLNIDGIPMQELLDIGAYGWVQDETLE